MKRRIIICCLIVLGAAAFLQLHSDVAVPLHRSLEEFPTHVGEWRMVHEWRFEKNILENLKASGYVSRLYSDGEGNTVELYLGYHDGGPDAGPIHSPRNCLPGSGWYQRTQDVVSFEAQERPLKGVWAIFDKGEQSVSMLYWFQVCGKTVTSEYALKLGEILGSITSRRRDSAFIRLSTEVPGGEAETQSLLQGFAADFYPSFEEFLPAAPGWS